MAKLLGVTRPTSRSDLMQFVMQGYLDAKLKVGYFPGNTFPKQNWAADEVTEKFVREVMSFPVVLRETATVIDAVVNLFLENVGSLTIVDANGAMAASSFPARIC